MSTETEYARCLTISPNDFRLKIESKKFQNWVQINPCAQSSSQNWKFVKSDRTFNKTSYSTSHKNPSILDFVNWSQYTLWRVVIYHQSLYCNQNLTNHFLHFHLRQVYDVNKFNSEFKKFIILEKKILDTSWNRKHHNIYYLYINHGLNHSKKNFKSLEHKIIKNINIMSATAYMNYYLFY